jgi:MFS family permease
LRQEQAVERPLHPPTAPARRRGALSLLADPAFRRVWLVGTATGTVRWLEFLATSVYVFEVTRSPFQVALLAVIRMLPLPLLGAFAGALAERLNRRTLLAWMLTAGVAFSAAQAGLAAAGLLELWHVWLGALLNGVIWAVDMPVRRTLLGEIAGPERTAPGMALDTATNNATRMLGPGVGGLLLETSGIDGAFALGAALYVAALSLLAGLALAPAPSRTGAPRILSSVMEGLRIVRADRALVGTLAVTVIFNVLAWPATSMVPVIGEDVLGLSAFPIGLIMSADGLGALLGAVLVATLVRPPQFRGLYICGVALYIAATLGFALSPWPVASGLLQVAVGVGNACFATMQATIVFLSSPIGARSRIMGVLSVCIGTAPLGFLHVGWLADLLGAQAALLVLCAEATLAMGLALWRWPEIRPKGPFRPA